MNTKNLSDISIKMLLLSGIFISFGVAQKLLEINIFPEKLEAFAYSIFFGFCALTLFISIAALIQEISEIRKTLEIIAKK